jgi:hypothetical protein
MNESRVFMLNGTEVSQIVTRLENFFRTEKGMEVQSSQTTDGYVMQASQPKDGWKTLTGMRLALTVQMAVMGDKLNVSIGEGQWSDKIGAGAIGLFVAWPLAIPARRSPAVRTRAPVLQAPRRAARVPVGDMPREPRAGLAPSAPAKNKKTYFA